MEKTGAFEWCSLVQQSTYRELHPGEPYLIAHFYYGQGYYSEWKYDPYKNIYIHQKSDMGGTYGINHTFEDIKDVMYTIQTCIGSCCCPNDDMKEQRLSRIYNPINPINPINQNCQVFTQ